MEEVGHGGRVRTHPTHSESATDPAAHLGRRFRKGLTFAAQLHAHQARKVTGAPYISHLVAVAIIALEHGGSKDEVVAALLHDAVENQGSLPTLKKIRRRFGDKVAQIVEGCTAPRVPGAAWRQRRAAYLARLRKALGSMLLVSAADKLANARAILNEYRALGDFLWAQFNGTMPEILWY